jgi:hypothetical protein
MCLKTKSLENHVLKNYRPINKLQYDEKCVVTDVAINPKPPTFNIIVPALQAYKNLEVVNINASEGVGSGTGSTQPRDRIN